MRFISTVNRVRYHRLTTLTRSAEIERYIIWSSQALSCKIGELKIRELRAQAEQALGADFDLRQFHGLLLRNGSLLIAVLERLMQQWISAQRCAPRISPDASTKAVSARTKPAPLLPLR